MSPKGSPECGAPLGGLMSAAGPSSAGKKASSAFAPTAKGRFDSGPGSMYGDASKATPPPTFNPNDRDGFGAKAVTSVKPSAGFAPTAKGRFDAGPGSMYASATPAAKKSKKTKPADPMDEKAAEWSKALGLGAVAGAKAAPMLKAVDEARERAEATAAEAIAAKEEAEASAAEAVRKSEWITRRADERVAEAEIEVRTAESALAAERAEHDETRRQLQELAEAMAAKEEEMAEMRRELKHGPKKASPKAAGKAGGQVVDRRPVRLRHQLDNEAEAKAEMLEQRKAKREEHWKRLEEERRAKEERLLMEQEERRQSKAPPSVRSSHRGGASAGADSRRSEPPSERRSSRGGAAVDAVEALKAMAFLNSGVGAVKCADGSAVASERDAPATRAEASGRVPLVAEAERGDDGPSAWPPPKSKVNTSAAARKPATKPTAMAAAEATAASDSTAEATALREATVDDKLAERGHVSHSHREIDEIDESPAPSTSGRPTGISSAVASDAEDAAPDSAPLDLMAMSAPAAPAAFKASEHAPTDKPGHATTAGGPHNNLFTKGGDRPARQPQPLKAPADLRARSLDSLLDDGTGGRNSVAHDLCEGDDDGMSAAQAAIRAVEAQRANTPSKIAAGRLSSLGSLGSLGSLKLSESFGSMTQDAFLERLSRAEGQPSSPSAAMLGRAGLGHGMMPTSPMAMAH